MDGEDRRTVMVVDDDETTLQLIRTLLEEAGFSVTTRAEALGTSAQIQKQEPDFVLLDVNMPLLTGDQIANVLNTRGGFGKTRLIFYSARSEQDLESLTREHGAHGFIRKTEDLQGFLADFQRLVAG